MLDSLILLGLPYAALVVCIGGSIYRFRTRRFSYSSLSSQFLESKRLLWGSVPWHVGILVVLIGHLVAFLFPSVWGAIVSNRFALMTVEVLGVGATGLAIVGLTLLLHRRLTSGRIQAVTTTMDFCVIGLLLAQIVLGLLTALNHRWGAQWATGTVVPYVWSLITLRPDVSWVVDMPPLVKAHLALAWLLLMIVPFSRLVHVLSLPLGYLFRAPQVVVWANPRRWAARSIERIALESSRRHFLKGGVAITAGAMLLAVGTVEKLFRFFLGPRVSSEEAAALLEKKLARLKQTAHEKELELERARRDYIFVSRLCDLSPRKGRYFIDYQMQPALAFRDTSGLPLLISAKCTHLGCTVASDVNEHNQILCPCHVSWFDIRTGVPNQGSPAKDPLPILGWVLMDDAGKVVLSKPPAGTVIGEFAAEELESLGVYIVKREGGRLS